MISTTSISIRRESRGNKKKTSELTSKIFSYAKKGFQSIDKLKRSRVETRTGCGAHVGVRLDKRIGKFIFILVINNIIIPSKQRICSYVTIPSKITASQATQVDLAEEMGILLRLTYELISKQAEETIWNVSSWTKNIIMEPYLEIKKIAYGEVGAVLQYFSKQTSINHTWKKNWIDHLQCLLAVIITRRSLNLEQLKPIYTTCNLNQFMPR